MCCDASGCELEAATGSNQAFRQNAAQCDHASLTLLLLLRPLNTSDVMRCLWLFTGDQLGP